MEFSEDPRCKKLARKCKKHLIFCAGYVMIGIENLEGELSNEKRENDQRSETCLRE